MTDQPKPETGNPPHARAGDTRAPWLPEPLEIEDHACKECGAPCPGSFTCGEAEEVFAVLKRADMDDYADRFLERHIAEDEPGDFHKPHLED